MDGATLMMALSTLRAANGIRKYDKVAERKIVEEILNERRQKDTKVVPQPVEKNEPE